MSYKGIFKQHGFKSILETDFCMLLERGDVQYVIYKNTGIRCLDLSSFCEVSVAQIQYIYGDDVADGEEYEFTYGLDQENLINYLFGLIPYDKELCPNVPNANYFGGNLMIRKNENQPALILSNRENLNRNVLLFSDSSYKPLFYNRDCFLFTCNGEKELVIAYNPFHLLTFTSKMELGRYATILFLENGSESVLELPFEYKFQSYSLIVSTSSEYVESLRFIVKFINLMGYDCISFSKNDGRGRIEILLAEDYELLRYIQMGASIQKVHRELYPNTSNIENFKCKKIELLESKFFTITFNISRQELDILADCLISFYKIPVNFMKL